MVGGSLPQHRPVAASRGPTGGPIRSRCRPARGARLRCSPWGAAPLWGHLPVVFGSVFAWWRGFLMQPFEMGDQLRLTSPTAKVETEHLISAFGRRTPD